MAGRLTFPTLDTSWERQLAALKGVMQRREIQQYAREMALRAEQDAALRQWREQS